MTLGDLFGSLVDTLRARHEASIVLEEASGASLAALLARPGDQAPQELVARARALSDRRLAGEPLQHVIGHWAFRRLDLLQDRRALIARPETEVVVEAARGELARQRIGNPLRALDLGTGSGAIALSLVLEDDDVQVLATDRSTDALELVAENRGQLPISVRARCSLVAADWFAGLGTSRFHLIVSNPPYVSLGDWQALDPVVRDFDPPGALIAGPSGLECLEHLIALAPQRLEADGALVCEIGSGQGAAVRRLSAVAGATKVEVQRDLAGRDRVLVARF